MGEFRKRIRKKIKGEKMKGKTSKQHLKARCRHCGKLTWHWNKGILDHNIGLHEEWCMYKKILDRDGQEEKK